METLTPKQNKMNQDIKTLPISLIERNVLKTVKEMSVYEYKIMMGEITNSIIKDTLDDFIIDRFENKLSDIIHQLNDRISTTTNLINEHQKHLKRDNETFDERIKQIEQRVFDTVYSDLLVEVNKSIKDWNTRREQQEETWSNDMNKSITTKLKNFYNIVMEQVKKWYGEYVDKQEEHQTDILRRLENLENFKKYMETKH